MITLVLAALQWLGFVDLSARAALPPALENHPADEAPVDGHIWIGSFVLSGSPTRA